MVVGTVSPSEDPEKVMEAVEKVVGGKARVVGRKVILEGEGLGQLKVVRDQLRDRHVRGAARRLLLAGIDRGSTTILLNRQAAAAGVVALCGSPKESPLGPIFFTLRAPKLEEAIDWLTSYEAG